MSFSIYEQSRGENENVVGQTYLFTPLQHHTSAYQTKTHTHIHIQNT